MANSTRGRQPKGSVAIVAVPWLLSDLEIIKTTPGYKWVRTRSIPSY